VDANTLNSHDSMFQEAIIQTADTFLKAGWDFIDETANGTEDIWWIDEGKDYPRLWWELIPNN
jgi:hypothetical protein